MGIERCPNCLEKISFTFGGTLDIRDVKESNGQVYQEVVRICDLCGYKGIISRTKKYKKTISQESK